MGRPIQTALKSLAKEVRSASGLNLPSWSPSPGCTATRSRSGKPDVRSQAKPGRVSTNRAIVSGLHSMREALAVSPAPGTAVSHGDRWLFPSSVMKLETSLCIRVSVGRAELSATTFTMCLGEKSPARTCLCGSMRMNFLSTVVAGLISGGDCFSQGSRTPCPQWRATFCTGVSTPGPQGSLRDAPRWRKLRLRR